jgi:hypothetical protein
MHILILAALFAAQPGETIARVKLDALTLDEAQQLDGRLVAAQFTVGKPGYTWDEGAKLVTVVGVTGPDFTERTVMLKGNRLHDTDVGAKVTVMGNLRVIRDQDRREGVRRVHRDPG